MALLPKKLYRHPHVTGWSIPNYGNEGLLLFSSRKKALEYSRSDAAVHGEKVLSPPLLDEIALSELPSLLQERYLTKGGDNQPQAVILNISNDDRYDMIWHAEELFEALNTANYKSADSFQTESISNLMDQYDYQPELTAILDNERNVDFDQAIINEIVLWKVNRFVNTQTGTWLELLNDFQDDIKLDEEKLREFLRAVLKVRGVRLAMASTFLRFRNPQVYQIIDERTFRVVMRQLGGPSKMSAFTKVEDQIDLYIDYLHKLRNLCDSKRIPFEQSDRILYQFDISENGDFN